MDMTTSKLQPASDTRQWAPMVPAVDIFENRDGITLKADLPGVDKQNLSIGVAGDTLTIEGAVSLGEPASLRDVYAEIGMPQYRRSFVLGADLDSGKIEAKLEHGVLTLHIPKLEQAKPRRIEVKADA